MSVLEPLYRHDPARVAVAIGDIAIPYGRLCADIDTMAAWLAGEGLKPGERVVVFARAPVSPNYWDWIMLLGAMRAGLVHSAASLPGTANEAAGPPAAAIGAPGKVAKCAGDPRRLPFQPQGQAPLAEQIEVAGKVPKSSTAAHAVRLFKTSGTTGTPKVVAWDDRIMGLRLAEVRSTSGIGPETRLFNYLGMITTTSLRHSLGGWQIGCQVLLTAIGDSDPELWPSVVACDHLVTSPFRLDKLLTQTATALPGREERTIELLGGRIPPTLLRNARERLGGHVRNLYGSTEAGMVAGGKASLIKRHPGAVGFAVPGAEIEIVDDNGVSLPPGEQGTVRVRTQSMAEVYLGSDEPLQRDGWFYPGDIGILAEDGMFAVVGRASDTINVGGAMIAVAPLEDKIRELPGIEEVCIVDVPGTRADLVTVAICCPADIDLQDLLRQVTRIAPRGFRVELCRVQEMPRNEMGKIVRRELAARIAAERKRRRQRA